MIKFLTKIFGSKNERELKTLRPFVERINALEQSIKDMSDEKLNSQTSAFKERLENGESLDDLLPEAFATVREASVRTLKMRHFDVQLIGGIVLHYGRIAEMKTGEGKTLAATLPAYLNALSGKGVHIVTVNDYLAKRDAEWMGNIYNFLGMSVGTIIHDMDDADRKQAYSSDIVYGTNNEFGFYYLRDNMKFEKQTIVQSELNFAIVDEVDSILIDEARTPLIISGSAEQSTSMYYMINSIMPRLKKQTDYTIDEKARSVALTDQGIATAEAALQVDNLYDHKHIELLHHVNQALKAHTLFKRDVDYIVDNKKVVIVDEFTGRLMAGRRYSEGLHQALEAKENVKIENENQTLATITFQNYFRMYKKLAGMTGTADTEATEFKKIYDLDVIIIPTDKKMIREDHPDVIYKTKTEKFKAAIDEITELNKKGQPVLVGTISIDISESLSKRLEKRNIKHNVLNAKNHLKEAEIISMAGQKGAVTISTNMAGRGTDIVLGEGVIELGGLHILGTERHESRRIDNQLRGRSGRQGDPGSSRFYLSLDDDLLRIFGGQRITTVMEKLGMEEGEPIEHNMISRAIENAQSKVEGRNFDIRKHLIEYDDVMNQQREIIYKQRRNVLMEVEQKQTIQEMIEELSETIVLDYADEKIVPEDWDWKRIYITVLKQFNFELHEPDEDTMSDLTSNRLFDLIYEKAMQVCSEKETAIKEKADLELDDLRQFERMIFLQKIDSLWKDHLLSMDHLKEGIGLRGYAQQNPIVVYKKEGFDLFQGMIERIKQETIETLFRAQIFRADEIMELEKRKEEKLTYSGSDGASEEKKTPVKRTEKKTGRNAPCACGSGKKFKKCCGK